jgi:MFS family permease
MTFARYRQIFRERPFRRFWLGFTFSVLGDGMTHVALTWFVYERTRSAEALGWLMLCYTGPLVVGGLLAGALLDRFGRRRVMLVDNVARGIAVAIVPLLAAVGQLALWHIYAVAAVYGLLMMISLAGAPALIPSLVRDEQLATANALEMLSFTLGGVVGPPLAGLLIGVVGAPNVVLVDALSYGAFALALATIRSPGEGTEADQQVGGRGARGFGLGQAVRLLLGNRILLATTLMFLVYNIGNGALAVWLPILADQTLGGGSGLYGALLGCMAAGEVISALLAGGLALSLSLGALICLSQFLSGVALLVVLATRNVWGAALGLALFGLFSSPLTIWAQTLRMRIIPERLRGRTFALLRTLMQGGRPLGSAIAGPLLPVLGVPAMIALSALLAGAPGLAGYGVAELRVTGSPREEGGDRPPALAQPAPAEGQSK